MAIHCWPIERCSSASLSPYHYMTCFLGIYRNNGCYWAGMEQACTWPQLDWPMENNLSNSFIIQTPEARHQALISVIVTFRRGAAPAVPPRLTSPLWAQPKNLLRRLKRNEIERSLFSISACSFDNWSQYHRLSWPSLLFSVFLRYGIFSCLGFLFLMVSCLIFISLPAYRVLCSIFPSELLKTTGFSLFSSGYIIHIYFI